MISGSFGFFTTTVTITCCTIFMSNWQNVDEDISRHCKSNPKTNCGLNGTTNKSAVWQLEGYYCRPMEMYQPQEISLQSDKWRDLIQQLQITPKIHSNLKLNPVSTFSFMAWVHSWQLDLHVYKKRLYNLVGYLATKLLRKDNGHNHTCMCTKRDHWTL